MKAWEIVGYADTENGAVYCLDCARSHPPDQLSAYTPIFASSEDWELNTCDDCLALLNDTV